jgi:glyoxylate reductase
LVSALPPSVRFICHNGAGYDHINVPACSARSPPILVSNTPTAVNDATADLAVFLILGALRGFNKGIFDLRRGNWLKNCSLGRDPQGLVLGILGMGGIGGALKRRTDRFGFAETIYCNRRRLELEMEDGARFVGFEELLESSDVLVIGLPLNVSFSP